MSIQQCVPIPKNYAYVHDQTPLDMFMSLFTNGNSPATDRVPTHDRPTGAQLVSWTIITLDKRCRIYPRVLMGD